MSIWDIFDKISADKHTSKKPEYIIVGLGNPGLQYENTRHNAGFMAADRLAGSCSFDINRAKWKAMTAEAEISGVPCLVMKPQTYMNLSGEAVITAMNFYKIPPERVIVMFDDISLEPSKIRIRRKGSHGGHNGIKSIIELSGSEDFPRIKIGVGKKPHPQYNLADWVLSRFSDEEMTLMNEACDKAVGAVKLMVQGKISEAMNSFNS